MGWWAKLKVWTARLRTRTGTKRTYWGDLYSVVRAIRGNVIKWGEAAVRLFLKKMRLQLLLQSREWLCIYDWSGKVIFFFGEPKGRRDKTGAITRCIEQRRNAARTPRKRVTILTMPSYPFIHIQCRILPRQWVLLLCDVYQLFFRVVVTSAN